MKKIYTRLMFLLTFLAIQTGTLYAQFSISGEFKLRPEYRDGYSALRDSSKTPYLAIPGRARLLFDYTSDKISTRFSFYDAWVFGQNNYSSDTISKNTVNVYEAWFKYNFTKGFGLKIGRIELTYDDYRFFGPSNWSMWGATHDVLIAQWESAKCNYKGDLGIGINNTAPASAYLSSYPLKNYKYLGYLWEQKKFFKEKLTLSWMLIMDAYQKASTVSSAKVTTIDTLLIRDANDSVIGNTIIRNSTTTSKTTEYPNMIFAKFTGGADAWLKLGKLNIFLSGYYQCGHYKDGRKIGAGFYAGTISYQIVKPLKLLVGYDHLDGNNFSDTTGQKTKLTGFNTLYGTAHGLYGYMDLWSAYVRDNINAGFNDLFGRATVSLNDKMSIEATYRWFSLPHGFLKVNNPAKGKLPYQSVNTSLGSEIDLMYSFKPMTNLEFSTAYCIMLPSATMETLQGIKAGSSMYAQYAYIMVTYKPNFFSSEKK
ncbi:MAG: alginate export family protein [Bacteroidetes bacterium]|nr:alginate export family protein [Bacteroidota bacterium]